MLNSIRKVCTKNLDVGQGKTKKINGLKLEGIQHLHYGKTSVDNIFERQVLDAIASLDLGYQRESISLHKAFSVCNHC